MAVTVINSGKTPALNFKVLMSVRELPKDVEFSPLYRPLNSGVKETIAVILPNQTMKLGSMARDPGYPREVVTAIKNGTVIVYFYGHLTYEDVSKRPLTTKFCAYLNRTDLTTFLGCDTYNDAD
jgi:hypothetical protein